MLRTKMDFQFHPNLSSPLRFSGHLKKMRFQTFPNLIGLRKVWHLGKKTGLSAASNPFQTHLDFTRFEKKGFQFHPNLSSPLRFFGHFEKLRFQTFSNLIGFRSFLRPWQKMGFQPQPNLFRPIWIVRVLKKMGSRTLSNLTRPFQIQYVFTKLFAELCVFCPEETANRADFCSFRSPQISVLRKNPGRAP